MSFFKNINASPRIGTIVVHPDGFSVYTYEGWRKFTEKDLSVTAENDLSVNAEKDISDNIEKYTLRDAMIVLWKNNSIEKYFQ